jgi:hypothetical protein
MEINERSISGAVHILSLDGEMDLYNATDLKTRAMKYILSEFSCLQDLEDLSPTGVAAILESHNINFTSEDDIFNFILTWVKLDEQRLDVLPELLKQVRLAHLTKDYLCDVVMKEDLMYAEECRSVLQNAVSAHVRSLLRPSSLPPRRPLESIIWNCRRKTLEDERSWEVGHIYVPGQLHPGVRIALPRRIHDHRHR